MTKKVPWYFSNIACDKKVPWVLFENYEIHPPTLWVLLGMCSIKKVPAPPLLPIFFQVPSDATPLIFGLHCICVFSYFSKTLSLVVLGSLPSFSLNLKAQLHIIIKNNYQN